MAADIARLSRDPGNPVSRDPGQPVAAAAAPPAVQRPRNWSLIIGAALVLLIGLLASAGPDIAPLDPLRDTYIKKNYAGEWIKPPFAPFTVPGFYLGSDVFGRDLLSQLLWALRPTLTLVLLVAALRLTLGITIGLVAGWSAGMAGRLFSSLISAALSVPVLFVALCTITLLGAKYGVWAFILGLVLTAWADVARTLREQTRAIKQRPYVEAARALGSSDGQLLYRHVLPQVMPLVWTLFSFEASGALLSTSALGFLGYFIHSIWLPHGDWTGIRATGKPELGQMLATAFEGRSQPWGMLLAGSAVFLTVLGLNLLGEGLRQRLTLEGRRQRESAGNTMSGAVTDLVAARLLDPLWPWRRTVAMGSVAGALLLVIGATGYTLWLSRAPAAAAADLPIPGAQQWASERRDPYSTMRSNSPGPVNPGSKLLFSDEAGFTGGPVVAADGTLVVVANNGRVCSLTIEGAERWCAMIAPEASGTPALGALGEIYIANHSGGLTALDNTGRQLWTLEGDGYPTIAGPIVSTDSTIYYPTDGHLTAVHNNGTLKWRVNLPSYAYNSPGLTLSPDGAYVFFEDVAVDTADGAQLTKRTIDPFDRFFVGSNGTVYLGGPNAVLEFRTTEAGAAITPLATFDARSLALGFRALEAAGVTADGKLWLLFNSQFENAKIVWFDLAGQVLGIVDTPYAFGHAAGIDSNSVFYLCGYVELQGPECRAVSSQGGSARWQLHPAKPHGFINGSALVGGRLYLTTTGGDLFVFADLEAAQ
jgi:peptide/nickel transport system permease protein